jgi:predicted nucleic acid-binding protein
MPGFAWAKTRYLDASALVKLVVDEPDCARIRQFFNSNINFCTTLLCLAEAISVLKRKWAGGEIGTDEYFAAARGLIINAWGSRIELDDIEFVNPTVQAKVEQTARKYTLDISDALQLVTILLARYSVPGPNSASVLIPADGGLAVAASNEGIRVWNCRTDEAPAWA